VKTANRCSHSPARVVLVALALVSAMVAACGGASGAGTSASAGVTPGAPSSPAATAGSSGAGPPGAGPSGAGARASAGPSAAIASAGSGAVAGAASSSESPAATLPPLPHVLISINDQGAYRGIISAATWAPAGPASQRTFGAGVPTASSLRQLRARIGSVLTIAIENRPIREVKLYAVPVARFTGQISTSPPFVRLRHTSSRVTAGDRVPFWAPDAGQWVVYAHIAFTDGAGDGTWFWRILVK
jgi:hypothetical protein